MTNAFLARRTQSSISTLALLIGLGVSASAHAYEVTFQFEGFVTTFSNSDAFGGVALNDKVTGTLTYDVSTLPNRTWGSWAARYTLEGGATKLSFDLGNGRQFEDTTLNAQVVDGPVYPVASEDRFTINDYYLDPSMYAKNGETQLLHLNFQNTAATKHPSFSAHLPAGIDLYSMPFSGGDLYLLSGPEPTGDDIYVINRTGDAYQAGPFAGNYPSYRYVTRYNRSNPNQSGYYVSLEEPSSTSYYPGSEEERYKNWLAAGNKPMYLDTLGFHMTSISAVPEADSVLMLLAGVAAIGMARRRAG